MGFVYVLFQILHLAFTAKKVETNSIDFWTGSFYYPTVFLGKMKIIYRPMLILVRREQEKYILDWKPAVNYSL